MGPKEDIEAFAEFEQHIRDVLSHLYDPTYQPPDLVWTVMSYHPHRHGLESIWKGIIQAIRELEPGPDIPSGARVRRIYELLSCRYLQELTQEETADRLGITTRHLRREQQQAVQALALRLWEQRQGTESRGESLDEIKQAPETHPSTAWRSQVQEELASLARSAPGLVADVGQVIERAVDLARTLTAGHNISLEILQVQPDLVVALHPSVLQQILIRAIEKLAQHMSFGQINLQAYRSERWIRITVSGTPVIAALLPDSDFIREILTSQGGSVEVRLEDKVISFALDLPSANKIKVLVVDDNADLVHFYRRYTTGTRYQMVHVAEGDKILDMIREQPPDIIVLDIMLPDVDGWKLLTKLREMPETRSTPIVICSVIRGQDLALALGAALYIPKPVRRQQLIEALDKVSIGL